MVATMKPYTLFVVDDDMPLNPRTDYDNQGKMLKCAMQTGMEQDIAIFSISGAADAAVIKLIILNKNFAPLRPAIQQTAN